jgi:gamma-glutamylcyclotransferase (GGCT)/AIG2-like uncharacterized protein YtfP
MAKMHRVLVYGTLRPFTNTNVTTVKGRLYDLGAFPGLILDDNAGDVVCEVVEVTEQKLLNFDMYEGYNWDNPRSSLYIRRELPCGSFIYEYNQPDEYDIPIPSGDWQVHKQGNVKSRLAAVLGKEEVV